MTVRLERMLLLCGLVTAFSFPMLAAAQMDAGASDDLPPSSYDLDPLATDRTPIAPRAPARPAARSPVRRGAVLSAISGVRETEHRVHLRFEAGLVYVERFFVFENATDEVAELVRYDLFESGIERLASIAKCTDDETACVLDLNVARAAVTYVNGRQQIAIDVGPIAPRSALSVRLRGIARAPLHSGRVRWLAAPRGHDARTAPAEVRVECDCEEPPVVEGNARQKFEPWEEIRVSAVPRLAPGRARNRRVTCAWSEIDCSRRYEALPPASEIARDVLLVLDVSPSTEGEARRMLPLALAAASLSLPEGSRVSALALASQAQWIVRDAQFFQPDEIARATLLELGRATLLSSLQTPLDSWLSSHRVRPLVIWMGDGSVTEFSNPATTAVRRAIQRGVVEFSVVALTGARSSTLGNWVDASHGTWLTLDASDPIVANILERNAIEEAAEHTKELFARSTGGVRSGFDRTTFEDPRAWLVEETRRHESRIVSRQGMPAETVLTMLRQRIIPRARQCFRADRRGRANYRRRATFTLLFERREVASVHVEGELDSALRDCLVETAAGLDVPYFDGVVRVRYPLTVEPEPPLPVLDLPSEIARAVDRTLPDVSPE